MKNKNNSRVKMRESAIAQAELTNMLTMRDRLMANIAEAQQVVANINGAAERIYLEHPKLRKYENKT